MRCCTAVRKRSCALAGAQRLGCVSNDSSGASLGRCRACITALFCKMAAAFGPAG